MEQKAVVLEKKKRKFTAEEQEFIDSFTQSLKEASEGKLDRFV